MSKKQIVFTTNVDGKEVELKVARPNYNQQQEGQKIYNSTFREALASGAILREKLVDFMKEQGIWDDKKQAEVNEINHKIKVNENLLIKGGISKKKGRDISIQLRVLKGKLAQKLAEHNRLDSITAQAQADDARFNYWVSACVVYNSNDKPFFKDLNDYQARSNEDYAAEIASKFASLVYNYDEDFEMSLIENRFLKKFNFINDDGHLINEDGHLISVDGKLIDKEGYYVDKDGNRVDSDGNPLDENGLQIFQGEFFDEDEEEKSE